MSSKLNCVSVEKWGLMVRKKNMQLLLLQRSKAATRHKSFLSSEDGYPCLTTVRLELAKREGNAKTGCKQIKSSFYKVKSDWIKFRECGSVQSFLP